MMINSKGIMKQTQHSAETLKAIEKAAHAMLDVIRQVKAESPTMAQDFRVCWLDLAESFGFAQCRSCEKWLNYMDTNTEGECYRCTERAQDIWEHDHDAYDNYRSK